MADNLAYLNDFETDPRKELLNGTVVMLAPRPATNHNRVIKNIFYAFESYLRRKTCETFPDGTDVYLDEKNRVIPDVMIVCNKDIIKEDGIHGTPDLIVEVLSPGTRKRDTGYKKDLYERCGVREYWIVHPEGHTVDVYLLKDGKFVMDEIYEKFPDYVVFEPGEREAYKDRIPVSFYKDFSVSLEDIFYNVF